METGRCYSSTAPVGHRCTCQCTSGCETSRPLTLAFLPQKEVVDHGLCNHPGRGWRGLMTYPCQHGPEQAAVVQRGWTSLWEHQPLANGRAGTIT